MIDGGAVKGNMRSSSETPVGSKMGASMVNKAAIVAKKEVTSSGGVVGNGRHVVRVSQQLRHGHHEGDQGIHLDYAQPRTHTPHHN